ncbi:MAG TPA: PIN domain-containing protein [Spirochaetota bacterium]|nr:PIN domain-containing protein [Spirochaetota bacterium]
MKKICIDTDVILDLFTKREPFYHHAAKLFTLVESGRIRGHVSSLIFSNLYYIIRKQKSKNQAISILRKLKTLVTVLPVDDMIIELALSSEFSDFEDAIQYHTAKRHNLDYIITRNIKDFKNSEIEALPADLFLGIFETGM